MSTAELNISANNWITGSSDERPKDKQIYAIVTTGRDIRFCQYRRNMYGMKELLYNLNMPTYFSWSVVKYWKHIDLLDDVEKQILMESHEGNGI